MDYNKLKRIVWLILLFPVQLASRFRADRCSRHAAALAFSSLLALAPLMAIMFSMFSLFFSFEQFGGALEDFIYRYLIPTAGDDLRVYLEQFAGQTGKLTVVGLFFFLLTALLLLFNIEESFNDIWRIERGRTLGARIIIYWTMVSLGPLLMGASLTMSAHFLSMDLLKGGGLINEVSFFISKFLPFIFEMVAFGLLYLSMPNTRVSILHAFSGALVASLLFELSKEVFVSYIMNFNNYQVVYGALSSLPIFLLWIYISWVVTLIGAEVVALLQEKHYLESLEQHSDDSDLV